MTPYLDLHTHVLCSPKPEHRSIYNVRVGSTADSTPTLDTNQPISAGIHPWDVNLSCLQEDLDNLTKLLAEPNTLLLGECGLDKLRGASLEQQILGLLPQLELARKSGKPVVYHCVRAHGELMHVSKQVFGQSAYPQIIHGFDRHVELAQQWSNKDVYLSFGSALFRPNPKAHQALQFVHSQGLPYFLETDDSRKPIETVYEQAAILLQIRVAELKDLIFASWKKIGLIHV